MLCFGFVESGKFKHCTKTLQHKMSSGYVYPANSLYIRICVYVWSHCWYLVPLAFVIHIRRGLVLLVRSERQYQSLSKRNSNNAVPLFYCVYR